MVLELVLALPVLVVLLLAVVEFGSIFASLQQLSLASRAGARAAAEIVNLPTAPGAPIPSEVFDEIAAQLAAASISPRHVVLEHNVAGSPVRLDAGQSHAVLPDTRFPATGRFVRVTVVADLSELAPDLLGMWGFSTAGRIATHTSTFRYEL